MCDAYYTAHHPIPANSRPLLHVQEPDHVVNTNTNPITSHDITITVPSQDCLNINKITDKYFVLSPSTYQEPSITVPELQHLYIFDTDRKKLSLNIAMTVILQIFLTILAIILFTNCTDCDYVQNNRTLLWGTVMSYVLFSLMACSNDMTKSYPWNYLLMILFNITEYYITAVIASRYSIYLLMFVSLIVIFLTFLITMIAKRIQFDFTLIESYMYICLILLLVVGLIDIIFCENCHYLLIIYLVGSIVLYCVYFVHDLQMIVRADCRASLHVDQHIYGALCIYLDINNLFIYLLLLLN
jgi:protein lifeguard